MKLVSHYLPSGRNHLESISRSLVCINKSLAKAVLSGQTETGVPVHDRTQELDNADAYLVCKSICEAIAADQPVEDSDNAFRCIIHKKGKKRAVPDEAETRSRVKEQPVPRKCSECTVNFARVGEPTCNACRPKEEAEAEKATQKRADTRESARNKRVDEVVYSLAVKCPCGNHARLWKPFNTFRLDEEEKMDATVLDKMYEDDDALDEHVYAVLDKFRVYVADLLADDPRCNSCAS